MESFTKTLESYMDAQFPILYVDTMEYDQTEDDVMNIAKRSGRGIIRWGQRGMRDYTDNSFAKMELAKALDALLGDPKGLTNRILIIEDIHFFIEAPETIARLREMAQRINQGELEDFTVVLVAPLSNIPKELGRYLTILVPDDLTAEEISAMIVDFAEQQETTVPQKDLLDLLSMNLKGLSRTEIEQILSLALANDGVIDAGDLDLVREQKQQMIKKSGILEMVPVKERMEDIGGLENLKEWLKRKAEVFQNITKAQAFGVDIPKGVLIAGMPGCGKSLTAKAVAKTFNIPLLRMDMGRLMGKYVGESEGNMRRAIQLTEASSPCVLWIDELEKAFAGVKGGGSEVTTRLFGNFLTWMQEKDSLAFVVATANKIDVLPPELLRKGRFDEIFYVDFPNEREREKIFEIHIKKRRGADGWQKIKNDRLSSLVEKTKGYCGADIEGVVRESIEAAFVGKKEELTTDEIRVPYSLQAFPVEINKAVEDG
ncbi:MAG: AAA family ATPase [Schwartzia sp.]|nr:AAA family ATPase [Schwartzia sp. (in: firmicutes)]